MIDPETTYRTFISHTQRCRQCRTAGGELADDGALCPTGRALARQWDLGKKSRVVMNHFGLIATSRSLKNRRPNKVTDAVALLRDMVEDARWNITSSWTAHRRTDLISLLSFNRDEGL